MTLGVLLSLLGLGGCVAAEPSESSTPAMNTAYSVAESPKPEESQMWMTVGERRFAISLADNAAARALTEQLPLTLHMKELNGNEKYAELPGALPTDMSRARAIHNGDLMLYGTNTLVVFYDTFSASYSYTRLGRVDDPAGLAETLGRGSVRVTFHQDQVSRLTQ